MRPLAICDDSPEDLAQLEQAVRSALPEACVSLFTCPRDLLEALEGGYRPDIAVLDIQLDQANGIALARAVQKRHSLCRIVFVTDYLRYAPEVYAVRHSYFLLKPQLRERMAQALARAMEDLEAQPRLTLRLQGQILHLRTEKVLYLERRLRKTYVFLDDGQVQTPEPPARFLPPGDRSSICRCHQSYWVNLDRAASMTAEGFRMDDGALVPISRSFRRAVRSRFLGALHQELDEQKA